MDVTIILRDPILTEGGTIILLPQVAPLLDVKAVRVEVAATLSFVYFDHASNEQWSLRFDRAPADVDRSRSTRSKLLTVGSGNYNNLQGEQVSIEQFNVFHIFGSRVNERKSYAIGSNFFDEIKQAVDCKLFGDHARVCIAGHGVN